MRRAVVVFALLSCTRSRDRAERDAEPKAATTQASVQPEKKSELARTIADAIASPSSGATNIDRNGETMDVYSYADVAGCKFMSLQVKRESADVWSFFASRCDPHALGAMSRVDGAEEKLIGSTRRWLAVTSGPSFVTTGSS